MYRVIDVYILMHMQERLELTDEQFVKALPLVKRLQSDRRQLEQRRLRALHELRRVLSGGEATPARVEELLRELKTVESEHPVVLRKDVEAIDALLTPIQQAKYRVLELEVEQRIRELRAMPRLGGGGAATKRRREGAPDGPRPAEGRPAPGDVPVPGPQP
jgi:Spy/CpxP family protein refolding chaperone